MCVISRVLSRGGAEPASGGLLFLSVSEKGKYVSRHIVPPGVVPVVVVLRLWCFCFSVVHQDFGGVGCGGGRRGFHKRASVESDKKIKTGPKAPVTWPVWGFTKQPP